MPTLAVNEFRASEIGELRDLPHVGSALENPYVYDASARELKAMAELDLLEVEEELVDDGGAEPLITHLSFRRLR